MQKHKDDEKRREAKFQKELAEQIDRNAQVEHELKYTQFQMQQLMKSRRNTGAEETPMDCEHYQLDANEELYDDDYDSGFQDPIEEEDDNDNIESTQKPKAATTNTVNEKNFGPSEKQMMHQVPEVSNAGVKGMYLLARPRASP